MITSQEIKAMAKRMGADIVGIGSIDRWSTAPIQMDPKQIMPKAKSIIALGFRVLRGSLRGIEEGTYFSNYSAMGYGGITYLYMPMTVINLSKMIEDAGGVSHINHPGDWLGSAKGELVYDEDGNVLYTPNGEEMTVGYQMATDPGNVQFFANFFRVYPSCLGIEVYNAFDRPTRTDRVLWDGLLKAIIPEGRNVWGFANNDAHTYEDVDTCFMDFIHKLLKLFKHFRILPKPFAPEGIPQGGNAGNDQTHIVLGSLQEELGCFLVKMTAAQFKPTEEAGAAHGTHDDAVFDLHITHFPGGKQGLVFLIHMYISLKIIIQQYLNGLMK